MLHRGQVTPRGLTGPRDQVATAHLATIHAGKTWIRDYIER